MAVDSMQIQYTDLRQLINIDPPVYDYEADDDQYMVSLTSIVNVPMLLCFCWLCSTFSFSLLDLCFSDVGDCSCGWLSFFFGWPYRCLFMFVTLGRFASIGSTWLLALQPYMWLSLFTSLTYCWSSVWRPAACFVQLLRYSIHSSWCLLSLVTSKQSWWWHSYLLVRVFPGEHRSQPCVHF